MPSCVRVGIETNTDKFTHREKQVQVVGEVDA